MTDTSDIKHVLVERHPLDAPNQYLGLITLNRPDELNPLDWDTVKAISVVLDELIEDPEVCVIAFTGNGRAFSAGGDLVKYGELFAKPPAFMGFLNSFEEVCLKCQGAPKPVIGLINGWAVAGGIEIMLAFDFSYAAKSARIGDGHANYGMIGGGGANYRLPRRIAPGIAFENLMSGDLWTAEEALAVGLVNKVVPDDELLNAGLEFANKIAQKSPLASGLVKELFYQTLNVRETDAHHLERHVAHRYLTASQDALEGLNAFAEKRKPSFKGE